MFKNPHFYKIDPIPIYLKFVIKSELWIRFNQIAVVTDIIQSNEIIKFNIKFEINNREQIFEDYNVPHGNNDYYRFPVFTN